MAAIVVYIFFFCYTERMNKKLITLNYAELALCAVFTCFHISVHADISLAAFFVCALFTFFLARESSLALALFHRKLQVKHIPVLYKLYQYVPFVLLAGFILRRSGSYTVSHWYNIVCVLLWLAATVVSLCAAYYLNPKRAANKNPVLLDLQKQDVKHEGGAPVKRCGLCKILFEMLDWADAIVQAVCTVVLINIFIFQLYIIPSESMVSEFLIGDRVIGFKTLSAPRFPISDAGLPPLRSYKRGDIVIFRNPHYEQNNKAEVKSFISQLVLMFTLTKVNLNVDETGAVKADPLVKRVTGMPGEQLVMQDGVLYSRTKEQTEFQVVTDDQLWAEWNVAGLPEKIKQKIITVPLSQEEYNFMLETEQNRRNINYADALEEARSLSRRFAVQKKRFTAKMSSQASAAAALAAKNTASDVLSSLVPQTMLHVYTFFSQSDTIIRKLLVTNGGEVWFEHFVTDWAQAVEDAAEKKGSADISISFLVGGDIYADAMFRQNLALKLAFARLAVRTAELLNEGVSATEQNRDSERLRCVLEVQGLIFYLLSINDMRNMPVFPASAADGTAEYIPAGNYFMMGDNRFNSLDMRHSYQKKRVPVTAFDTWTLYYDSNMEPQYVPQKNILGTPVLRFFPPNRFGVPGLTAQKSSM